MDDEQFFNDNVNEFEERYCIVAESLEQSFKEMQLMREGKIPKKTWKEYMEELDND